MPNVDALLTPRQLYGGAMTISLPDKFADVSGMRQIPDHQEVFVNQANDQSFMVDLLQYQSHVQGADAARFHFNEIAECNNAVDKSTVTEIVALAPDDIPGLDPLLEKWLLCGQQAVAKYKEEDKDGDAARNAVMIYLLLVRLPAFTTDIVVTFNDPVFISQTSSSMPHSTDTDQFLGERMQLPLFKLALRSLAINDYGLFGQDEADDDSSMQS
ncbi:hypothetical protein CAOG_01835 [Capsaspora owczarzaki ATCC 30864]|uniref:Ran guanine nucleotide release factor n=1 Tax=Capsaspora owczarzaki (strain ATCC 30864) TaxID=595528 RepID=A0A0D2WK31_CAPO3|nr:hypothetical protein CAOG_01835 [Capsaspora owczarzaki ATCC 30864]KJE90530.1 hypothetical protein CAOG_001835 [Capsaspora owczarzaki ATCC 30864]|eukprot:XP_004364703.1 hypothetical protein CAOG_01835 [Capsaspora owczarzaki ATCC 30864]